MPFDAATYEPTDAVLRNLIAARAMIANEANWCVGERVNDGGQRCALGALDAVLCRGETATHASAETAALARFSVYSVGYPHPRHGALQQPAACVAQHNNDFGHAATLEMFDRAIAARKAELLETDEVGAVASNASA